MMKIYVLVENTTVNPLVKPQKGLSLYIENNGTVILFDMGSDMLFIENARAMGLDIKDVDLAVISHGHNDHGGGLRHFLEKNSRAPVYVHEDAFGEYIVSRDKEYYIGLERELEQNERVVLVKDNSEIADGVNLMSAGSDERVMQVQNEGLYERKENTIIPDIFVHELNMAIEKDDGYVLFTGCAHRGIVNIMESITCKMKRSPDTVVGGFHLNKFSPDDLRSLGIPEALKSYDSKYFTGHCTGTEQYDFLRESLGGRLSYLAAGSVIEVV